MALAVVLMASVAGCSRQSDALEIPTGSDVTLQKKDGVTVAGRLVEVQPEQVVVESREGLKTRVPRAEIASLRATPVTEAPRNAAPAPSATATQTTPAGGKAATNPVARVLDRGPEFREVTVPAGTVLPLELKSSVASDTSNVEDAVRATLRRAVTVNGVEAFPAGSAVDGIVTSVQRSAKVKGRAQVAFRFNRIDLPGDAERLGIRTDSVTRLAAATKKKDATKIGVGAGAGAVIGGILGGGSGAAKGAAVGGAAGTGVVLATRGEEVRLGPGAPVRVKLLAPVTVRVAVGK